MNEEKVKIGERRTVDSIIICPHCDNPIVLFSKIENIEIPKEKYEKWKKEASEDESK